MTDFVHGVPMSKHPLYGVWKNMRARCYNPNARRYLRYGGRGIAVCAAWRNSSVAFCAWAVSRGWAAGLQLDRIDNDGDYSPENCRFVTPRMNANNRGDNVRLASGEALSLAAVANGLSPELCRNRVQNGWTPEAAVTVPNKSRPAAHLMADGRGAAQVARANGISSTTYSGRIRAGWGADVAATVPASRSLRKNNVLLPDGRAAVLVARANGITSSAFYSRLLKGWPIEDAVSVPLKVTRRTKKPE